METKTPPRVVLPARMVPSFNVKEAFDRKVERKFLINTWGGLGDQVCAEPAIRYALKAFPKCEISLASRQPRKARRQKPQRPLCRLHWRPKTATLHPSTSSLIAQQRPLSSPVADSAVPAYLICIPFSLARASSATTESRTSILQARADRPFIPL